jgi:uncharacterized protein (TIGR02145 family)
MKIWNLVIFVSLAGCASQSAEHRAPSEASKSVFVDARDGTSYGVRRVGGAEWLEQNAKFKVAGSLCYQNDESFCTRLGRLYTWEQAQKACDVKNGWHVSTDLDWKNLETELGMTNPRDHAVDRYLGKRGTAEGAKLKRDPAFGMTEFTGFFSQGAFAGRDESEKDVSSFDRSYYWAPGSDGKLYRRNLRKNTEMIHRFSGPAPGFHNPVRCVRKPAPIPVD